MDLYWKNMRVLYSEQAKDGLPKIFAHYMPAFFFLQGHPKFASVLEPNEKSGSKKKGCKTKMVSQSASVPTLSTRKQPSSAIVNSERLMGRDSAKKKKATESVIEKVTQELVKAVAPHTPQGMENPITKSLQEGLTKANNIMQTMANHQVMSMTPQDVRDHYFEEAFDLINVQARNKRLCLQVENEELALCMKKMEKEQEAL